MLRPGIEYTRDVVNEDAPVRGELVIIGSHVKEERRKSFNRAKKARFLVPIPLFPKMK